MTVAHSVYHFLFYYYSPNTYLHSYLPEISEQAEIRVPSSFPEKVGLEVPKSEGSERI